MEMSRLALFLIWSVQDAYKLLEYQSQPWRLMGTFSVTTAHFLDKCLFKFISQIWLRRIIVEALIF